MQAGLCLFSDFLKYFVHIRARSVQMPGLNPCTDFFKLEIRSVSGDGRFVDGISIISPYVYVLPQCLFVHLAHCC